MRANSFRRIAADLTALHDSLPPNYLFDDSAEPSDDLSSLDILLAGPPHTPFADGLWKVHFDIPAGYPQEPPTANFRTPIFHPNVDSQTGSICVETLKRGWKSTLTLSDLLVTISCLLIQPNPDSALNAEAGALIQEDFDIFARRAKLMTNIHAAIPHDLIDTVRRAQGLAQDDVHIWEDTPLGPTRHRGILQTRRLDRHRARSRSEISTPVQSGDTAQRPDDLISDDQENATTPDKPTPRRAGMPLRELEMDYESASEMEAEYPPSPKKSPRKVIDRFAWSGTNRADDLRLNLDIREPPLLGSFTTPAWPGKGKHRYVGTPEIEDSTLVSHLPAEEQISDTRMTDGLLWGLCGRDTSRWNRGDFDGQPFPMTASRW